MCVCVCVSRFMWVCVRCYSIGPSRAVLWLHGELASTHKFFCHWVKLGSTHSPPGCNFTTRKIQTCGAESSTITRSTVASEAIDLVSAGASIVTINSKTVVCVCNHMFSIHLVSSSVQCTFVLAACLQRKIQEMVKPSVTLTCFTKGSAETRKALAFKPTHIISAGAPVLTRQP